MQPQMQETTTAATRDKPGVAVDRCAKSAASLTGDLVTRRSLPRAALASAEPTAARCASEAWRDPGPAPVRPDDGTSAGREERLTGLVQTALAGLRALGSRLVPEPAADGARHGLRWPNRRAAAAIFVSAYLFFLVAILAGHKFMPGLLFPQ